MADFSSEEGVQQGDGLASAGLCAGIHPEIRKLDVAVAASGGAARFGMDDGYVIGPPDVVFPAIEQFACDVRELGLEMRFDKNSCYLLPGKPGSIIPCVQGGFPYWRCPQ